MLSALLLIQTVSGTPLQLLVPAYGITADDYPAEALALEQEGRVVARLSLDETGAITGCEIAVTSGSAALDAGTCAVLRQRARFSPALDGAGKPRAVHLRAPINWQIPPADGEPVLSQSLIVAASFGRDLVMRGCSAKVGGYEVTLTPADCQRYVYLFPIGPLRIASGDGARAIRAVAQQRQEYDTAPGLPEVSLPGTLLARVTASFRIDAHGRASGCVVSDRRRLAMLRGGLPCAPDREFDVASMADARFPIRATWTTTTTYTVEP